MSHPSPRAPRAETAFETARGVSQVEVKTGLTEVQILDLAEPMAESRLTTLAAIRDAGVSVSFLKYTPDGFNFSAKSEDSDRLAEALERLQLRHKLHRDYAVMTVHAVNMRDEAGLVARIVSLVLASGATIISLGELHDRLMIVMSASDAAVAAQGVQEKLAGVTP